MNKNITLSAMNIKNKSKIFHLDMIADKPGNNSYVIKYKNGTTINISASDLGWVTSIEVNNDLAHSLFSSVTPKLEEFYKVFYYSALEFIAFTKNELQNIITQLDSNSSVIYRGIICTQTRMGKQGKTITIRQNNNPYVPCPDKFWDINCFYEKVVTKIGNNDWRLFSQFPNEYTSGLTGIQYAYMDSEKKDFLSFSVIMNKYNEVMFIIIQNALEGLTKQKLSIEKAYQTYSMLMGGIPSSRMLSLSDFLSQLNSLDGIETDTFLNVCTVDNGDAMILLVRKNFIHTYQAFMMHSKR